MEDEDKNKASSNEPPQAWDMDNLHDFFKLLLEVDKRVNPKRYKAKKNA